MPATRPIKNAPTGVTQSHPAVIATSPARAALKVMDTSGFPYRSQVKIIAAQVATAAAILVLNMTRDASSISASVLMATVEPPLNPNQQNQRMNTPRAQAVMLCPGIARAFPSFPYFPMRGPKRAAPRQATRPPTMCTQVEPAKS